MTLGAISAMEDAGIVPGRDIVIITVDGQQAAVDLLKAGRVNCVIECKPTIGDDVMALAKKLAAGEDIDRAVPIRRRRCLPNLTPTFRTFRLGGINLMSGALWTGCLRAWAAERAFPRA